MANSRPDDMNTQGLIRWAAEYVGWGRELESPAWDTGKRDSLPGLSRYDLHALVGLVEDKVRGDDHLLWDIEPQRCVARKYRTGLHVATGEWIHKDPLIARLGALRQLVEKIENGN